MRRTKTSFLTIVFLSLALTLGLAAVSLADCSGGCPEGTSCIQDIQTRPDYQVLSEECCANGQACQNLSHYFYQDSVEYYHLNSICYSGNKDCCVRTVPLPGGSHSTTPLSCDISQDIYYPNNPNPLPYDPANPPGDPAIIGPFPKEKCCAYGGMGLSNYNNCCPTL